jgi:hypothetical protein
MGRTCDGGGCGEVAEEPVTSSFGDELTTIRRNTEAVRVMVSSSVPSTPYLPKPRFVEKRKHRLVPVRKRPWHAGLPVGYGVSVSIRHFHLRQRRLGEDFVLLNHTVLVEQERGERVHLVRLERAFLPEGHAAIDVVPYDRRVRRMQRDYTSRSNAWLKAWRRAL